MVEAAREDASAVISLGLIVRVDKLLAMLTQSVVLFSESDRLRSSDVRTSCFCHKTLSVMEQEGPLKPSSQIQVASQSVADAAQSSMGRPVLTLVNVQLPCSAQVLVHCLDVATAESDAFTQSPFIPGAYPLIHSPQLKSTSRQGSLYTDEQLE